MPYANLDLVNNCSSGVAPGEGTGATMSDDDEDQADSEMNLFDESLDGPDSMGFGPLVPTESERSLMERVKQELKHELKQVKDHGPQQWCFSIICSLNSVFSAVALFYRVIRRRFSTSEKKY